MVGTLMGYADVGSGRGPVNPDGKAAHAQVANTSRRARELWSIVNERLVAMIRVRNAIAD